MSLTVLKAFRHEGRDYRSGEPAPTGLNPRTKELLIRTRHLHDPKAKSAPRETNELQVTKNADFPADKVIVAGLTCPVCFTNTRRHKALDNGVCHVCGYTADRQIPVGSVAHLEGRELALGQDWTEPLRDGPRRDEPGVVLLDKAPADALAGRKLAAQQDWGG